MKLMRMNAMEACLRQVSIAVSTVKLYGENHAQVERLCQAGRDSLSEVIADAASISLLRVDDQLAINNQPLPRSLYGERFARFMKMGGVGHIKFLRSITTQEIHALVVALTRREATMKSTENMRFGQVEVRKKMPGAEHGDIDYRRASHVLEGASSEELAKIMEVYGTAKRGNQLHITGLSEIVAEFINIFGSYADPILCLVPLRSMDEYTFTHSMNVCLLNLAQATALGINGPLLHDIGLAAMLHDVGKLFIPEEVLNKSGPLDEQEHTMMQQHPVKGAEYLLTTPGVPRLAVVNAYEHHMRYDLCGYPHVKNNCWEQNLCSHMTAISDVYDALRTKRPYREPMEVHQVLACIEEADGSQLHPLLVENFLRLMRKVHPDEWRGSF
jgi:HD-GYP domain-containing protein (c-di-GMP phosphodiesterase class II)